MTHRIKMLQFIVVSGEDLEFVDVNQDEMPGETWDSFESSDFYDSFNNQATHVESAATSTTNMKHESDMKGESSAFNENDNTDAFSENDEMCEWSEQEQNSKQSTLLYRGGFFRFLRKEGSIVRAECLSCKERNEYSGQRWSNSNFLKHMHVRSFPANSTVSNIN